MLKDWILKVLAPEFFAQGAAQGAWRIIQNIIREAKDDKVRTTIESAGKYVFEVYKERKNLEHKRAKLLLVMCGIDPAIRAHIVAYQVFLRRRSERSEDRFTLALIQFVEQVENDLRENKQIPAGQGAIEYIRRHQAAALEGMIRQMPNLEEVELILNTSTLAPVLSEIGLAARGLNEAATRAAASIEASTARIRNFTSNIR